MEKKEEKTQIGYTHSKDHRIIFANRVFGGWRLDYFEMNILNESTDISSLPQEKLIINSLHEATLVMTPSQVKSLLLWLMKQVEYYEKQNGLIKTLDELSKEAEAKNPIKESTTTKKIHEGPGLYS